MVTAEWQRLCDDVLVAVTSSTTHHHRQQQQEEAVEQQCDDGAVRPSTGLQLPPAKYVPLTN